MFRVEVIGGNMVANKLRRIAARLPNGMDEMTGELAKIASAEAKKNIKPRFRPSTGNLKAGITAHKAGKGKWSVMVRGKASQYAGYVEFGTDPKTKGYPRKVKIPGVGWRNMKRHPGAQGYPSQYFMRKAFKRAVKQTKPVIKKHMRKVLS